MEKAKLKGVTLEYEVKGSGEPVLLITGAHIAAGTCRCCPSGS